MKRDGCDPVLLKVRGDACWRCTNLREHSRQLVSFRASPTKIERAQVSSCHGGTSVAQENWAHRVLKSRGVDPTDGGSAVVPPTAGGVLVNGVSAGGAPNGAGAGATSATQARSAGQVYSSMMKTLRAKAAKLRRRLLEEVALEDVDGGPLGGSMVGASVAAARGVPQDLQDGGESLAQVRHARARGVQ